MLFFMTRRHLTSKIIDFARACFFLGFENLDVTTVFSSTSRRPTKKISTDFDSTDTQLEGVFGPKRLHCFIVTNELVDWVM